MSDFIQQILLRHASAAPTVQPRLRGKYEPLPEGTRRFWGNEPRSSEFSEQADVHVQPRTIGEGTARRPESEPRHIEASEEQNIGSRAEYPVSQHRHLEFSANIVTERADRKEKTDVRTPDSGRLAPPLATALGGLTANPFAPTPMPKDGTSDLGTVSRRATLSGSPSPTDAQNAKPWKQPLQAGGEQQRILPNLETRSNQSTEQPTPFDPSFRQTMEQRKNTGFGQLTRVGMEGPTAPVIKVSIGRIEVRAVVQQAHSQAPKNAEAPRPRMSLEDYLKKRNDSTK